MIAAIQIYFRFMYWLLKISLPINLVLFPAIAVYGHFNDWPPAQETLSQYADETPVMIGAVAGGAYSRVGDVVHASGYSERSYILFPSVFRDPRLITVIKDDSGTIGVHETTLGLVLLTIWYVLCLVGTWWFWFRRSAYKRVAAGMSKSS